jgi:hypothetical protein
MNTGTFKVVRAKHNVKGERQTPNEKRHLGDFPNRQKARAFCRNHKYSYDGLVIVHPDGTKEPYE